MEKKLPNAEDICRECHKRFDEHHYIYHYEANIDSWYCNEYATDTRQFIPTPANSIKTNIEPELDYHEPLDVHEAKVLTPAPDGVLKSTEFIMNKLFGE